MCDVLPDLTAREPRILGTGGGWQPADSHLMPQKQSSFSGDATAAVFVH